MSDLGIREFFTNDKFWGTIFFITSFGFFVVPLNFYILGDHLAIGIQSLFWRYQITPYGNIFINYFQDVKCVGDGVISGISAVSLLVWAFGVLVYLVAIVLINLDYITNRRDMFRFSGFLIIFSVILLASSLIIQYGFFFHGPAGVTIPFGIPVLLLIGCGIVRYPDEVIMLLRVNKS